MKIKIKSGRVFINITRYEALLLKDAISDFQYDRSETHSFDSQNDPIIVAQMVKKLEKEVNNEALPNLPEDTGRESRGNF